MYRHRRDCVRTWTVRSHVRRVADKERDGRGPLQRSPINRSRQRRDLHGRSDAQRLGTNRSAVADPRIDGSIAVVGTDRKNHRELSAQVERDRSR
jgi:hypothetical protein